MEVLKETKEYTVYKKRSGRFAVKAADGKMLNGAEKVKVLQKEGVIKVLKSKPKEEAPAEEETAAPAEETPAAE